MKKLILALEFTILGILMSFFVQANPDVNVESRQYSVPILKFKEHNPVLQLKFNLSNIPAPVHISSFKIGLVGTDDLNDIQAIRIWYLGNDSTKKAVSEAVMYGEQRPDSVITFKGDQKIKSGTSYFLLTCDLSEDADLHHKVKANCLEIKFNNQTWTYPVDMTPEVSQRIGVAVRKHIGSQG